MPSNISLRTSSWARPCIWLPIDWRASVRIDKSPIARKITIPNQDLWQRRHSSRYDQNETAAIGRNPHPDDNKANFVGQGYDTQSTNSSGQTPLPIAIERGHISVVRYLLQICGVSPSPDLLFVASNSELTTDQKASIVGCLVENGVEVDTCSVSDIQHLSPNASGALHLGRTAVERGVYPRS